MFPPGLRVITIIQGCSHPIRHRSGSKERGLLPTATPGHSIPAAQSCAHGEEGSSALWLPVHKQWGGQKNPKCLCQRKQQLHLLMLCVWPQGQEGLAVPSHAAAHARVRETGAKPCSLRHVQLLPWVQHYFTVWHRSGKCTSFSLPQRNHPNPSKTTSRVEQRKHPNTPGMNSNSCPRSPICLHQGPPASEITAEMSAHFLLINPIFQVLKIGSKMVPTGLSVQVELHAQVALDKLGQSAGLMRHLQTKPLAVSDTRPIFQLAINNLLPKLISI